MNAPMMITGAFVLAPKFDFSILLFIPFVAMLMVMIFPWPITRYLLIPMGLVVPAYGVAHLSMVVWGISPRGGGLVAAAWATLNGASHPEDLAWVEERLGESLRLNVCEVVAFAILCASRGQHDDARTLFQSVALMTKDQPVGMAQRIALEWLTVDAAERGDWSAVEKAGHQIGFMAQSRTTRLLSTIAQRMLGTDEVPPSKLWMLWIIAPRRSRTLPLVQRALSQLPGTAASAAPDAVVLPAEADEDPLTGAMLLHAALLKRAPGEVCAEDLGRLCQAWDEILQQQALDQRAEEIAQRIAHPKPKAALERFGEAVYQDIARLALGAQIDLDQLGDPQGPTLTRVSRAFSNQAMQELELTAEALSSRVKDRRALGTIDEWREFLALRSAALSACAVGGQRFRRLAFSVIHPPLCSQAVWLYNERRESHAAHAIFVWLLAEAEAVGDEDAIRLQKENTRQSRG